MIINNDSYEEKAKDSEAAELNEGEHSDDSEMSEPVDNTQNESIELPSTMEISRSESFDIPKAEETAQVEPLMVQEPAVLVKTEANEPLPWLTSEEIEDLRSRWKSIQIEFVDAPRTSVEKASVLVSEALKRIEQLHTDKQAILAQRWNNHEEISTEDLRVAIQSYRLFLYRLLE